MGERKSTSTDNGHSKSTGSDAGKIGGDAGGNGKQAATGTGTGTGAGTGAGAGTLAGTGTGTGTGTEAPGKTDADNNATVKPVDLSGDIYERDETGAIILNADGTKRKKRGRKKGQSAGGSSPGATSKSAGTGKPKSDRAAMATEMLAAQFQILNTGLAYLTRFEDWKLDDAEAMQMAQASANVMEQFDYVPDPKVTAVLGLVTTTSMIYGPRLYLYRKHLQAKTSEGKEKRIRAADEQATQPNNGPGFDGPLNMGQFSG